MQLVFEQLLTGGHWNPPKLDTPRWKTGKATMRWQEGHNHDKIKSHTCWVGTPQTGKQLHQTSSSAIVKVLHSQSGFPAWGSGKEARNPQRIWLWRPAQFDYSTSTGLAITVLPQDWGKQRLHSWRTQRNLCEPQDTEERKNGPELPAHAVRFPVDLWVGSGWCKDRETGSSSPESCPLV